MTWQNSQLLSRSRAPAGPRAKSPGAQVPSIRNRRLRPLGTRVAAAGLRGTGRALPLTPSGPAAPTAAPLGSRGTARPGPGSPLLPVPDDSAGPSGRPDKGAGGAGGGGRRDRAAPASVPPSLPPGARRAHRGRGATPPAPRGLRSGPALPRERREAAARRGRGGGGGRHHVCPPLPEAGCSADKARRRRGRSGRPGRPRRPPRNTRGQEPRKPGALMQ